MRESLEETKRRHKKIRGDHAVEELWWIGPYLAGRINDKDCWTVEEWVAYLVDDTPCTRESIHNKMARVLQNRRANQRVVYPNSPIVKGTDVVGAHVAADVNPIAYRSVAALLHLLNEMPPRKRRAMGFAEDREIPVLPAHEVERLTAISSSGKHCRSHFDSEKDCRKLHSHCKWVKDKEGGTNCVPKNPRTRSPMGTPEHTSAKKAQRDLPGQSGARIPRGNNRGGWRQPEARGGPV